MRDVDEFHDFIRRIRSGDEKAAADLVAEFEPYILRVVRFRMRKRGDYERLRREVGSSDVCQSVFRSLFEGLKKDRFSLDRPADLEKLLWKMVWFSLATQARKRSVTLRELLDVDEIQEWEDPGPGPDQIAMDSDLLGAIHARLSEEESDLLIRRLNGQTWSEISSRLDESAEASRKRLKRAMDRAMQDLNP